MKRSTTTTSLQIEILEDRFCLNAGMPMSEPGPPHHHQSDHGDPGCHQPNHHGGAPKSQPHHGQPPPQQFAATAPSNSFALPQNSGPSSALAIQSNPPPPQLANVNGQPHPQGNDIGAPATADFFAENIESVPPPTDVGTASQRTPANSPEPRTPTPLLPMLFAEQPPPGVGVIPLGVTLPMVSGMNSYLPDAVAVEADDTPLAVADANIEQSPSHLMLVDDAMLAESVERLGTLVEDIWLALPHSPKTMVWIGTTLAGSLVMLAGCSVWMQYRQMLRRAYVTHPDAIQWPNDQPSPWEAP